MSSSVQALVVITSLFVGQSDSAPDTQSKNAVLLTVVRTATTCIFRTVASDPRRKDAELSDLITDAFKPCRTETKTLVEAYDRYYGEGEGEAFLMGPYLTWLPTVVQKMLQKVP